MPNSLARPTNRKRIALLIHSMEGGGAERAMSQLANRWSQEHEVHLVTWSESKTDRYALEPSIIRHGLGLQAPSGGFLAGVFANIRRVRVLRQCLRNIGPDLILSFCDQMNIVALEAARPLKQIPIWIAEHSDPEKQQLSTIWEAWRRRSYPRCTGCVALTENIAEYMLRWIPQGRLQVIPSALKSWPVDIPYQASNGAGKNTLLFVGRLSGEKRVDLLLEAWKLAAPQLDNWQLTIVGDGVLRADLEKLASELPSVRFAGWSSTPESYFAESQLFVMCSRYEGFPVALLEALSHGLPAITTACSSAISELQAANFNEFLKVIESDSVEALSEAIVELASDAARRQNMSQHARDVASQYTWEIVGPKWDKLLDGEGLERRAL